MIKRTVAKFYQRVVRSAVTQWVRRVDEHLVEAGMIPRIDMHVRDRWNEWMLRSPNPLNRYGEKFYSQHEEDGIIREITRRLDLETGTFVEIGSGDGLENNTLLLLMSGWSGVWIDGVEIKVEIPRGSTRLTFERAWITRDNVADLVRTGLKRIGRSEVDFLSVDVDGNDLHLLGVLLGTGMRPRILVVEYNAKFPPPIRFSVAYDPLHRWEGTDYMGASLQSFLDLLEPAGYRLVCCNITGTNAFFVRVEDGYRFADVPSDTDEIFMPPAYLWSYQVGHPASPRTIETILTMDPPGADIGLAVSGPVAKGYLSSR